MNTVRNGKASEARHREIGRVGTVARILIGLFLVGPFLALWAEPSPLDFALGLIGFPALFVAAQALWGRRRGSPLMATGPLATLLDAAIAVALFSFEPTRPATALFVGASLLVAGFRGYAGCEVTAISNWLLRRNDQIGCVVLSPIDAADPTMPRSHGVAG